MNFSLAPKPRESRRHGDSGANLHNMLKKCRGPHCTSLGQGRAAEGQGGDPDKPSALPPARAQPGPQSPALPGKGQRAGGRWGRAAGGAGNSAPGAESLRPRLNAGRGLGQRAPGASQPPSPCAPALAPAAESFFAELSPAHLGAGPVLLRAPRLTGAAVRGAPAARSPRNPTPGRWRSPATSRSAAAAERRALNPGRWSPLRPVPGPTPSRGPSPARPGPLRAGGVGAQPSGIYSRSPGQHRGIHPCPNPGPPESAPKSAPRTPRESLAQPKAIARVPGV